MPSRARRDLHVIGCDELWLQDGFVILHAGGQAFRVYKDVLSRNSEIFKDLFSLSQPENTPSYYGCPIIQCYDTAEELKDFLLAFFESAYLSVARHIVY